MAGSRVAAAGAGNSVRTGQQPGGHIVNVRDGVLEGVGALVPRPATEGFRGPLFEPAHVNVGLHSQNPKKTKNPKKLS